MTPMRVGACLALLLTTPLLGGCSTLLFAGANLPAALGDYDRLRNLDYGREPRQQLDVYMPERVQPGGAPVIVFWHGGGWTDGDKDLYRFVGAALAEAGFVAVLPNYRLYPQSKFPAFVEDGALALRWVRENAARHGGDPGRLFVAGHSAGAHEAALLAYDPRWLAAVGGDPGWIRGVIALSGPHALEADTADLRPIFAPPFGPADWKPVAHASARSPPTLLLHGASDDIVDIRHSEALASALRAAGADVTLRRYEHRNHADTVASLSIPARGRTSALADIRAFVARTGASRARADR